MPETILGLDPIQWTLAIGAGLFIGWIIGQFIKWMK